MHLNLPESENADMLDKLFQKLTLDFPEWAPSRRDFAKTLFWPSHTSYGLETIAKFELANEDAPEFYRWLIRSSEYLPHFANHFMSLISPAKPHGIYKFFKDVQKLRLDDHESIQFLDIVLQKMRSRFSCVRLMIA